MLLPFFFTRIPHAGERAIALQCLREMSAPLIAYLIHTETKQEKGARNG